MAVWRARKWEADRRAVVARAFRQVPFYREKSAAARGIPDRPVPVPAQHLAGQLFRLCPITRPWRPSRDASPWLGRRAALAEALSLAGVKACHGPVLEVRRATVDWERLTAGGRAYGVLLAPDAAVRLTARPALQRRALDLARTSRRAVVVGSPSEIQSVKDEVEGALGHAWAALTIVHRLTPGEVFRDHSDTTFVVHDPYLGYLGARVPTCGEAHVLWRRFYCEGTVDGLVFTALRSRRPVLVDVLPVDPGCARVGRCGVHGTPVLTR